MIKELQDLMLKEPQFDVLTEHFFTDDAYARQITIPKGILVMGATHKTKHFFMVSKGSCVVNDGSGKFTITAPYIGITEKGTKRAIYALEDCVWTTFHVTTKTDLDEIENDIIEYEGLRVCNSKKRLLT